MIEEGRKGIEVNKINLMIYQIKIVIIRKVNSLLKSKDRSEESFEDCKTSITTSEIGNSSFIRRCKIIDDEELFY
jgi:hypothetical protein